MYGSNTELQQISRYRDSNTHDLDEHQDVLTYHLPRVIFSVETDNHGKLESVDASDSGDVWLTREDCLTSGTNRRRRRRRRNFVRSIPDPQMDSTTSNTPKEGRRHCSRCATCCKSFLAFLFSTVGLTLLLIVYSIIGGLVFMELEADKENRTADEMEKLRRENLVMDELEKLRRDHLVQLWEMTSSLNVFHPNMWMTEADKILENYTVVVYKYTKRMGWDVGGQAEESQWSFAGSLLYAITVITTIGTRQSFRGVTP